MKNSEIDKMSKDELLAYKRSLEKSTSNLSLIALIISVAAVIINFIAIALK